MQYVIPKDFFFQFPSNKKFTFVGKYITFAKSNLFWVMTPLVKLKGRNSIVLTLVTSNVIEKAFIKFCCHTK